MLSKRSAQYGIVPQHGGAAAATARIRTRRRGSFDAASMETSCIRIPVSYDCCEKGAAGNDGSNCYQPQSICGNYSSQHAQCPQFWRRKHWCATTSGHVFTPWVYCVTLGTAMQSLQSSPAAPFSRRHRKHFVGNFCVPYGHPIDVYSKQPLRMHPRRNRRECRLKSN